VFGEAPPFSIEALRVEMDDLLAWTDKLRVELDTRAAHQYLQVERLVSANRELSVQFDLLQAKFDHFINEHWQPMQHFACGVVSCLAVFAGNDSYELPFNVRTGGQPWAPVSPPPSGCPHSSPVAPFSSQFFSDAGAGIDSLESLPSLLSQSSHSSLPSPPSSSGSWDEIEPHFVYSQLDAGRRQLSQGEFLALFSTPEGGSPEPGTTVTYGVSADVSDAGEGVRIGGGPGGV